MVCPVSSLQDVCWARAEEVVCLANVCLRTNGDLSLSPRTHGKNKNVRANHGGPRLQSQCSGGENRRSPGLIGQPV